jgi:uncharacterized membrane protein (DUF106 family)
LIEPLAMFGPAFTERPLSTIVIIIMALGVNTLYSVGRRLLTDVERSKRIQAEIKEYQKELREAITTRNKAKEEKLKKRKPQMDQLQAKSAWDNMKVTFLFFVPLLLLWWFVQQIVGTTQAVAISPIPFPLVILTIAPQLNFFWWYMICSFALSGILTKAFGVSLTD